MANEPNDVKPNNRGDRVIKHMQDVVVITMVVLIALGTLCLSVVGVAAYFLDHGGNRTVQSVEPAGRVIAVTQTGGWRTRSLVETDQGFYSLCDGVSFKKLDDLTLETRGNNRRYLCTAQHQCTQPM